MKQTCVKIYNFLERFRMSWEFKAVLSNDHRPPNIALVTCIDKDSTLNESKYTFHLI